MMMKKKEKMMPSQRSSSNKGITKRNTNVQPPAINTQDNTRGMIPGLTKGVTWGEGEEIKKQVAATGGLPKVADLPTPTTKRPMPQVEVWSGTQRKSEPVTAGLPFGPGINPQPQQQVLKAEEVRDFVYNSWLETGDDSLLEYI